MSPGLGALAEGTYVPKWLLILCPLPAHALGGSPLPQPQMTVDSSSNKNKHVCLFSGACDSAEPPRDLGGIDGPVLPASRAHLLPTLASGDGWLSHEHNTVARIYKHFVSHVALMLLWHRLVTLPQLMRRRLSPPLIKASCGPWPPVPPRAAGPQAGGAHLVVCRVLFAPHGRLSFSLRRAPSEYGVHQDARTRAHRCGQQTNLTGPHWACEASSPAPRVSVKSIETRSGQERKPV